MKDVLLINGLDLTTPRALVKPGYLEDCYNYEIGIYPGLQPSGGFERCDGHMSPSTKDIWDMVIPNTSITMAYMNKSLDITTENPAGIGLFFSADGTRMYTVSYGAAVVYQYHVATPWDVSTAFYMGVSFAVNAQDTVPTSLSFSADGTKMYVMGETNAKIFQYTLVIPWDIATASYASLSLLVSAQEPTPRGMCFKPDGTAVFVTGNADVVVKYTLATPWAINTGTHTTTLSISTSTLNGNGVQFHPDGYLFLVSSIIGGSNSSVNYYSCATAWDISTATYLEKTFSVDTQQQDVLDIFIHPDGGVLYTIGITPAAVHQYGLNPNINENLTWTLLAESGDLGVVIDVSVGASNTTVRFAYWDLDDALPPGALVTGDDSLVTFREGLESSVYASKTINTTVQDTSPQGIWFRPTGLMMYVVGDTGNAVDQWNLSTAWDVSSATYSDTFSTAGQTTAPKGVALSSDGTKAYVLSATTIYQYTLSPAWDVTGGAYATKSLDFSAKEPAGQGMTFSSDGTKVYIVGARQIVYMYTLATAWDISTGSFTSSYTLEWYDGSYEETDSSWGFISGITFNSAGTRFYVVRSFLGDVHEYTCTAWNIATAIPANASYSVRDVHGAPKDIFLRPNDKALFILATTTSVYEYTLYPDVSFTALTDSATDIDDYTDQLAVCAEILREAITPVPGTGPVLGIKLFQDQVHAIRDYYTFKYLDGNLAELHEGQHVVVADGNDLITSGPSVYGDEGIVRSVITDNGSYSNSNARGSIVVEPLDTHFDLGNRLARGNRNNFIVGLCELHFTSGSTEPTLGQELVGATSTNNAWVFRVELQSGSWAGGDAAGIIYCYDLDGVLTDGELIDRVSPAASNILTLDEALYGASQDKGVVYFAEGEGAAMAGLYKSSHTGWEKVDLGWVVHFSGGANEPTPVKFGADTASATVTASSWGVAGTQRDLGGWTPSAGSELDAIGASAGAYINPDSNIGYLNIEEAERYLIVHNFGIVLPAGARVVGVEIEITAKNTAAATAGGALINVQPFLNNADIYEGGKLDGMVTKRQSIGDLTTSFVAYTFGSANDLWGAVIDADMVQDTNFGLKFTMEWDANATWTNMQVDFVRMRVHYVEQGQRIYFYDTAAVADYTSARLVHLNVESGTWAGANAVGVLYLYDLYKGQIPTKNIQIRTAAAGAGSLIANMVGNELRMSLPGSKLTKAAQSKYELIAENVYARDDLEAIYGASGAGQAFSYDGYYARFIHSGLSPDLDKPRHLALFQFRLWLGYVFGEAAISTSGEPLVFDGSLNAVATGFGRPITGMVPLAGKTMGVYTDQSVYAVTVNGVDFDQQVFAAKAGALEYTVQSIGQNAMYLDMRGISTPYASQNYGDFDIERVSKLVQPWLLPRIQGKALGTARGKQNVVATSASRSKNQYRLYFADGYRLSVTTDGKNVQITRQFLYTDDDPSHYIKVLATDTDVDSKGLDRMFFTMDRNPDYDHGDALGYVYEEDRGTSYDGSAYTRYIELTPIAGPDIHVNTIWNVLHLYGKAHGHADLKLTTALDFAHPADPATAPEAALYQLALGASTEPVSTELKAYWDKERIERRGRHLALRIQQTSDRALPHLLQHLALAESSAREER